MRIGVDYTAAAWQGAGIGRYTRELVRAAVVQSPTTHFVLFYAAHGLPAASPQLAALHQLCAAPNVRAVAIPLSPRALTILWQRARLPLPVELFCGRLDLVFGPDFVLPPTRARTLVTIHDLTFQIGPHWFEPELQHYLSRVVPRSLHRADAILADSGATRADLIRLMGVAPDRVVVLYPGVQPEFRPLPPDQLVPLRQHMNLPANFLLFVSTLEPRKNVARLVEAFHLLLADERSLPPGLELLIVGRRGWLYDDIFATVCRLGVQSRVRFIEGFDGELAPLYNLAHAFVYPSLYEGFGLPALEALACGTPLVTAAVASLPEVVGDAAVLVNPHDSAAIAAGIRQALADAGRLRQAGPARAQEFTWERAAHTFLQTCAMIQSSSRRGPIPT